MSNNDHILVDFYFCGIYQGKRKVGKDSIMGQVATGNLGGALAGLGQMVAEINQIPGAKATMEVKEDE
jgi:hypothetical protein